MLVTCLILMVNIVTCGEIRQSNCYYSSSDVTFRNWYEAEERYDETKSGNITLKGGWRIYSSRSGSCVKKTNTARAVP
jgi:cellobiose phosphorylase